MSAQPPSGTVDNLRLIQTLLVAASMALVFFGIALVFVLGDTETADAALSPALATGIVAVMGATTTVRGPRVAIALDPSSPAALVNSYRRRFILRLAIAESAALAGFLGSILSASFLPYAVGFCCAVIGFARIRPTPARIEADQEQLSLSGCPHSLDAALRGDGGAGA